MDQRIEASNDAHACCGAVTHLNGASHNGQDTATDNNQNTLSRCTQPLFHYWSPDIARSCLPTCSAIIGPRLQQAAVTRI